MVNWKKNIELFKISGNEDKEDTKPDSDHFYELIQNVKVELKETEKTPFKSFRPSS